MFVGIFAKSKMGQAIRTGKFHIPNPCKLPTTETVLPHVILGDEAFPILENLMKPFPRKKSLFDTSISIYNYRHSRARRIVENAFGLLSATFRIFMQPIQCLPENVDLMILTSCLLHNMLRRSNVEVQILESDANVKNLIPIESEIVDSVLTSPYIIRDEFKKIFNCVGAVEWQSEFAEKNS